MAGARQRLRDRGGARASVRADAGARAGALRAAHRASAPTACCCSPSRRSAASSPALRIFNPDGSEAELSGNGVREAVMYLRRNGWTDSDTFSIGTAGRRGAPAHHRPDHVHRRHGPGQAGLGGLPLGRRGRRGTLDRRRSRAALPVRLDRQPPVRDRGGGRAWTELDLQELGPPIEGHELFPQPHQRVVLAARRRRRDPGADLRARGGGDDVVGHRRDRRRRGRRAARGSTAR